MRFAFALVVAAASGFIALSYEILWYRVIAFASGGLAAAFGLLLASYLFGIAMGARVAGAFCKDEKTGSHLFRIAIFAFVANIAAWLVVPAFTAAAKTETGWPLALVAVVVAAALLGAILPLVSHFGIEPDDRAGANLSYVYLANIVGSALGSIVTGFVFLDLWTQQKTGAVVAVLGMVLVLVLVVASDMHRAARVVAGAATIGSAVFLFQRTPELYDRIWERLLYKTRFADWIHFAEVIETRSGVITLTDDAIVYGGGVYDGKINTSLRYDNNGIQRAYGIAAMHPAPKNVLMVGLSSGSWAKVVSEMPGLEKLTVVEINPGYLTLIGHHPEVRALLHDPKVDLVIDDGRRWLQRHDDRFDVIVMNTTFHWRAHSTNLLSNDFMEIVRAHLAPRGFLIFNATYSADVQKTAFTAFSYGMRVYNCVAVSDSPLEFDKERFRTALEKWKLDGEPVLDTSTQAGRDVMDSMMDYADSIDRPPDEEGLERRESLLVRIPEAVVITDDNMVPEWKKIFRSPDE